MEHDDPITKKEKKKNWLKSARVKAQKQTQKTLEILMVFTISKLLKLNTIRMNSNDSLRNVGYSRWQIR